MKKFFHYSSIVILLFLVGCQAEKSTDVPFSTDPQADKLQEIISVLEQETLDINRWESNSHYQAIEYAARDALDGFPDDPRAESWKWKLAYYSILAGDTQFGNQTYADLMEAALNSGEVQMDTLPTWFHPGELSDPERVIPFELAIKNIASSGQDEKYLIQISAFPGSSCFLATQRSQTYSVDLIYDGFPEGGYSYVYDGLGCTPKDLTDDGNDEVILEHYIGAHSGYTSLRVMDISVAPMQLVPFTSPDGENVLVQYENLKDFPILNGKNQMRTIDYSSYRSCWVNLEKVFEWNGNALTLADVKFSVDVPNAPLKDCLFLSLRNASEMDTDSRIKLIDQAVEQYEPVAVERRDKDKLDEIKLEKALLYLFADRSKEMRLVMQEVAQSSYQENGIWVEPAGKFLETYQDSSDIYRACSELVACAQYDSEECFYRALCDQRVLEHMVDGELKNTPLADLERSLEDMGVDVSSTGWFDLDDDGIDEFWFFVVPPDKTANSTDELWIASGYPDGISLFYIYPVIGDEDDSTGFQVQTTTTGKVFVRHPGYLSFLWSRDEGTKEPNLQGSPCIHMECYEATNNEGVSFFELRHQLQSGADPYQMYVEYMNLKKVSQINLDECAECYFDLGYIAELVGDEKTAVEMYSSLIERFPVHPLTILAKSKLERLEIPKP